MRWPWNRDRILSKDPVIQCPGCFADCPQYIVRTLSNSIVRGGIIITAITGAQHICPVCKTEYCVGPRGPYAIVKPSAEPPPAYRPQQRAATNNDDDLPMQDFAVPLERPRL